MIDASTDPVVEAIEVGGGTVIGIAVTPDGSTIFVNHSNTMERVRVLLGVRARTDWLHGLHIGLTSRPWWHYLPDNPGWR